ncbi:MAG: 2-oxoglutarate and iron-dependent oxygenase domain-containing protein [Ilumatobacteraceae bacterium]
MSTTTRVLAPVPIIDIAPFDSGDPVARAAVVRAVGHACSGIGFILVAGHGVPQDAIDDFTTEIHRFFSLPVEEKLRFKSPDDDLFQGYACPGNGPGWHTSERQSFNVQRHDTWDEMLAAGYPADTERVFAPALWPSAAYRRACRRYFEEMEGLAARLLRIFEAYLGLPDGWFADKVDHDPSTQAANWYSDEIDAGHDPSPYRFKAHLDGSVITILHQDDGPGSLQLHQRGVGWGDVAAVPGTFVVNLGEVLARWTNDRFVATPHRVLKPAVPDPRPRVSCPFFLKANVDAVIAPIPSLLGPGEAPKYPPVTGLEWLVGDAKLRYANQDSTVRFEELAAADPILR